MTKRQQKVQEILEVLDRIWKNIDGLRKDIVYALNMEDVLREEGKRALDNSDIECLKEIHTFLREFV